jgi:DNA-binding HxlR family transcriptional regulator
VEAALDVMGGKWKGVIAFHLMEKGVMRFNAIRRQIPNAPRRTITRQLRELEADGVIHREVYAVVPPKVEYSLTAFGKTLAPILVLLRDWGEQYITDVKALREKAEVVGQ